MLIYLKNKSSTYKKENKIEMKEESTNLCILWWKQKYWYILIEIHVFAGK
jgi:hypothetical protein